MTDNELADLPITVPVSTAARLMGFTYETLRKYRARGMLRDLVYQRPGPGARVQVVTKSIQRCLSRIRSGSPT